MKINFNSETTSRIRNKAKYNSVTGLTVEPDQLGISITKSVFGWKTAASGQKAANGADIGSNAAANNWIDTYGMPFIFVINGNQILLPPAVETGGTAVPPLPDGLTVQYAPSFMGVAIPSDFLAPMCSGGRLALYPSSVGSAQSLYPAMSGRAGGDWTANLLIGGGDTSLPNQGETLLRIIMAVMECLIYSYSSYPWGNHYNDLSSAMMTGRNYSNFLVYPYTKGTFLGQVLNDVAPVYTKYIAPVLGIAATVVAPGVGTAAVAGSAAALTAADNAANAANKSQPQMINAAETTQELPSSDALLSPTGQVLQASTPGSSISPLLIVLVIGAVLFFIFD